MFETMDLPIQNSVALVTAGTSGLGLAVAERLAQAGARVVVNYASNQAQANGAIARLTEHDYGQYGDYNPQPRFLAVKADITQRE